MKKRTGVIAAIVIIVALIAVGIYGYMTGRAKQPPVSPTPPVAEPDSPQPAAPDAPDTPAPTPPIGGQSVVVYVPDETAETLVPVGTQASDTSDQALADALIASGALPEGVQVQSAVVEGDVLRLDMNEAYGDAVRASGTAGEAMLIYALVDTFAQAYGVQQVLITVEGEPLESGHAIYDKPLKMGYTQ